MATGVGCVCAGGRSKLGRVGAGGGGRAAASRQSLPRAARGEEGESRGSADARAAADDLPKAARAGSASLLEEALYSENKSEGRQKLFTNISPVYDILNDALSLGLHRRWKRRVVRLAGCKRGDRALDVCCGSGDIAFLLARAAGKPGHVSALDFSANMLSYALQRSLAKDLFQFTTFGDEDGEDGEAGPSSSPGEVRGAGGIGGGDASTISWIHGDALALPFEDGTFDCVTIGYGLRNVEDRLRCLREVHRVLKPNKRAVVLDFNSPKDPASATMAPGDGQGQRQEEERERSGGWISRPRVINTFRNFCLDTFVVPVATVCGLRDEYAYLKPSIKGYPDGAVLVAMATDGAGFKRAEFVEMAAGLMGALVLEK